VDTFGHTSTPKIISLDYTGTQFEIYNKISRNYSNTFLFESLTGPEELAETSIMGFDPEFIVRGYYDKVTIQSRNNSVKTISTTDPLTTIKDLVRKTSDQSYRYLGGAVGIINYDAIRLWEKIPKEHSITEPIMEFGIYNDGILFDNKQKKSLYFYYDKNRVDEIKISESKFDSFTISDIRTNLDEEKFAEIVDKAKKYIYDGDIFQVVLSRKFSFDANGDYLKVYQKLRSLNPSPYLYHLKMNEKTVIGSSPEMLLRVTNDQVETFPIAGTRKVTDDEVTNERMKEELINDEKKPLINKSIAGLYPPGSTIKPLVALSALENDVISPNTTTECRGEIELYGHKYHCWKEKGHGFLRLREAIKQSCDIYFYEVARRLGVDRLAVTANKFGLGKKVLIYWMKNELGLFQLLNGN